MFQNQLSTKSYHLLCKKLSYNQTDIDLVIVLGQTETLREDGTGIRTVLAKHGRGYWI